MKNVSFDLSVIDASMFSLCEQENDGSEDLKLQFIEFFKNNDSFIGTIPIVGDLIPLGGGRVW